MKKYDFIAIGGGNAGFNATARAAEAGRRTALIDRGPIGGLCSLNGCNPKKVLVRSSELLDEIRHAAKYGIDVGDVKIDWSRVIDRKETFTNGVTESSEHLLKERGIDLITGSPRFTATNKLEVNGEEIEFGALLVSTGSYPRPLEFPGAEHVKTTNDILALRTIPKRLAIIGSGVVAFEFGQVFPRAGSEVTILTPGSRALSGEDEDLVNNLVEFSSALGVKLFNKVRVHKVSDGGQCLSLECEAGGEPFSLEADFILNAAGRLPSIGDLDLEKANVQFDRRGITVNDYLRSVSNPNIFAAGDSHGRLQLSPIATYEGRIVGLNYVEGDVEKADYETIPRAIYTVPALASVGLTEAEARKRGLDIDVHTSEMSKWKVYAIAGDPLAHAKVITEKPTDKIIGAHLLSPAAAEEIHVFAVAMKFGITATQLKQMVYAYPTFSSAIPSLLG
jgi:glutathione reductase (NADPH)